MLGRISGGNRVRIDHMAYGANLIFVCTNLFIFKIIYN